MKVNIRDEALLLHVTSPWINDPFDCEVCGEAKGELFLTVYQPKLINKPYRRAICINCYTPQLVRVERSG